MDSKNRIEKFWKFSKDLLNYRIMLMSIERLSLVYLINIEPLLTYYNIGTNYFLVLSLIHSVDRFSPRRLVFRFTL